ncbi:MAG TPA: alpha/beta hydrolase [Dehalococcoidia bacterium]|nr:alpha/beta hydrolase [Dehalococcoidia bacterium]
MASPQLQNIIQMLKARRIRGDASYQEIRAAFEQIAAIYPIDANVSRQKDDTNGVSGEWITSPGVSGETTIFYIHGGGWTIGSVNTHARLTALIGAAADARVFSIDYRLAPEHPYPAGLDDCITAYRWLIEDQAVDPGRLVIAGDSAGGNLTLATLLRLRDEGYPLPAAAVCLSPATDILATGESHTTRREADPMLGGTPDGINKVREAYCPGQDPKNPYISPLYGDPSGLPPLLIQVGDAEILLDDAVRFAQLATESGVDVTLEVWDEMIHVFQFFAPMLPEGVEAINTVGKFIKSQIGAISAA